ncbi:MAG: hypothetical protein IIA67_00585 [Planctomycetes bacterium]|nr:hypothetical protein [Planctomycetota bacterium]
MSRTVLQPMALRALLKSFKEQHAEEGRIWKPAWVTRWMSSGGGTP